MKKITNLLQRVNGNKKLTHNILYKIQALKQTLHKEQWSYPAPLTREHDSKGPCAFLSPMSTLFPRRWDGMADFWYGIIQHKKMRICTDFFSKHKEL